MMHSYRARQKFGDTSIWWFDACIDCGPRTALIIAAQIEKFMVPTWGPPGCCRSQMGPCWPHETCYQGFLLGASIFALHIREEWSHWNKQCAVSFDNIWWQQRWYFLQLLYFNLRWKHMFSFKDRSLILQNEILFIRRRNVVSVYPHIHPWASYQIRKIVGCACAGNAGNVFPDTDFKGNH